MNNTRFLFLLLLLPGWFGQLAARQTAPKAAPAGQPPIAIPFTLTKAGFVSLVIENNEGIRVRNLLAETWFPAGKNTMYWDGLDDLGRDRDAARHGLYHVPGKFVEPGKYRVRGIVRDSIKPFYEFATYSTGNPPWRTPTDHTGAWLANHTPPQAAVFVPAAQSPVKEPVVLLGCYVTEGPDGLAWVDLTGKKRGGKAWIGGHWTAAPFLAVDKGQKALPQLAAYTGSVWETAKLSKQSQLRINGLVNNPAKNDYTVKLVINVPVGGMDNSSSTNIMSGMAVHNGLVVVSIRDRNFIYVIDAANNKLLDSLTVPHPAGLGFDAQGRLLVLTEHQLLRFDAFTETPSLKGQQILVDKLEEPVALTLDKQENIYISDRGQQHAVKVFDPQGKYLRTIGKPGAPKVGPYDPLHMNNPAGLAIDEKNQLWVTEKDFLPKRVSLWSLDGKLLNAFYGPPKYGGGGTLDGEQKSSFYYVEEGHGAMEFTLDWQKGTSLLKRIYYRRDSADLRLAFRSAGPETPLYYKGTRYWGNSFNSSPTGGHSTAFLFIERNGLAYPAAAMGRAAHWDLLKQERFKTLWPENVDLNATNQKADAFFIWSDKNADAQVQPDEIVIRKGLSGGVTIQSDLSFCIARLGDKAVRFAPTRFNKEGIPYYDMTTPEVLANKVLPPASSGGDQALSGTNGWAILTLGMAPFERESFSGTRDGVAMWSYPNPWPGLHASHTAPVPDMPGQLIGPTRLMGGMLPMDDKLGPLWVVNGNHGTPYVFTQDGIFVASLFEVMRKAPNWRMPKAWRNMPLDSITLGEENFWPSITKTKEGDVYLVDGGRSSLVRLDGFNSVKRLPDLGFSVSVADLEKSRNYHLALEAASQQDRGPKQLSIGRLASQPVVDGDTTEWAGTKWIDIDKRGYQGLF